MSYTPTNWKKGDVVTSEKLNNIEGGISNAVNAVMVVNFTVDGTPPNETATADKTYEEIMAVIEAGGYVYGYAGNLAYQLHEWSTGASGYVIFWHWDDVDGEYSPYYIYIRNIIINSDGTVDYDVNTLTVSSE